MASCPLTPMNVLPDFKFRVFGGPGPSMERRTLLGERALREQEVEEGSLFKSWVINKGDCLIL